MSQVIVKVSLLGEIRGLAGKRNLEVAVLQGCTLQDLLSQLADQFGGGFARGLFKSDGSLHHCIKLFLDGDEIQGTEVLGTKLDGKQVDILMLTMYTGG